MCLESVAYLGTQLWLSAYTHEKFGRRNQTYSTEPCEAPEIKAPCNGHYIRLSALTVGDRAPGLSSVLTIMASNASTRSSADKEKIYGVDERQVQVNHVYAEEHPDAYYVEKYGALGSIFQKLFSSGVEARGVQRVPEDERDPKNMWNKYAGILPGPQIYVLMLV